VIERRLDLRIGRAVYGSGIFTGEPGGAGMDRSDYDAALAAYLADCIRRGLRPATIRYYRMVLESSAPSAS
jgi:hypothetical protein